MTEPKDPGPPQPVFKHNPRLMANRRALEAANKREDMIHRVGITGQDAKSLCAEMGFAYSTYVRWRKTDQNFGPRFDEAKRRAKKAWKNYDGTFVSFRKQFLAMDTTWFQQLIADAIESARPGEVVLILIPPGHGKTTLLEDWCTYKLVTDSSFRITVASETIDHGMKILDRVRSRLEVEGPTPTIATEFGPFEPESKRSSQIWGQKRFNVAQKVSDERDYSMATVGVTGRVQGTRCDLLLLDDIQDVKSLELSPKYYDIIVQSFLTRPEMFGKTVIIGTRVGTMDVYDRLIKAEIPDKVIKIPAYDKLKSPPWPSITTKPLQDDPSTWAPEGMHFLWPEKYDQVDMGGASVEGLHRFRYAALRFRIGEQAWWRNYMQRPEAASQMTFDADTTKHALDEHRSVIAARVEPVTWREDNSKEAGDEDVSPCPVIIGVDPAIGGGNGVLAAAARPQRLEILSAHLDYGLSKFSQIIDLVEEDCHRWTSTTSFVSTVVIEDKAFQKGLLQDDRMMELQRRFGFRIVPNTTGREKTDKDIGVPSIPMAMVRQEISIPWADEASRKEMHHLMEQLHMWRPGVNGVKLPQDLVMCLWFVYRQWRAVRDTPIHPAPPTENWTASSSPLRRRRRPTMSSRRQTRMRRGGWA